jgi:hypothetical protein
MHTHDYAGQCSKTKFTDGCGALVSLGGPPRFTVLPPFQDRLVASLTAQCRQLKASILLGGNGAPEALHTNGVSSTASQARENFVSPHTDRFRPFQHTQSTEEVVERE